MKEKGPEERTRIVVVLRNTRDARWPDGVCKQTNLVSGRSRDGSPYVYMYTCPNSPNQDFPSSSTPARIRHANRDFYIVSIRIRYAYRNSL
jgi:hypothetical protein